MADDITPAVAVAIPATTPTAPVAAPVVETPPAMDPAQEIVQRVMQEQVEAVESENAEDEQPRDELGRFAKKLAEETAAQLASEAPPTDTAPTTEAPPETPGAEPALQLPDGIVAVKPIEGRELAAQFTVLDGEGELAIPDLTIAFTANGRERKEPLDKVVKLAQMGVYNHEREQKLEAQQAETHATKAQLAEAQAAIQQYQQYVESLLADETAYLMEQERYAQANTPEAKLARLEAERQAEQVRARYQQQAQVAEAFATNELLPALDTLHAALPTVSQEEIGAKLVVLMRPYERNGIVPPEAFPLIAQAVVSDVLPWAQQLHEERLTWQQPKAPAPATPAAPSTPPAPVSPPDAQAKAAAAAQQKAKRQTGAILRPVGAAPTAMTTREAPPPAPPPATAREAIESSVQDIIGKMNAQLQAVG